jgi:alpha-galactosidase
MFVKSTLLSLVIYAILTQALAQTTAVYKDCEAQLKEDTLTIRNKVIEYKLLWNEGNVFHFSVREPLNGKSVILNGPTAGINFEESPFLRNSDLLISKEEKSIFWPAHLSITIKNIHEGMQVKRIIRIFPETPAVTFEHYLKYDTLSLFARSAELQVDGTEDYFFRPQNNDNNFIDRIFLPTPHWRIRAVRFFDVTDRNDNLVSLKDVMPYNFPQKLTGNLLIGNDVANQTTLFLLKEAPNAESQINYPGFDFSISNRTGITIPFSGFDRSSDPGEWVKGYSLTIGISEDEPGSRLALRRYLKNSINYAPADYEMVMMNTWGDRGRDGRIQEDFILKELEIASQLGISHFQIDDGWQHGLSKNSASADGSLWFAWQPEDWMPHPERFPNGLDPVIEMAREKGIRLGLWFNPTRTNNYANWETDADIIINIYKTTGIEYFKIDGIEIPTKLAEINLNRFFEKIKKETDNRVFFNLDLTAGTRGGYFSLRYTGNLFLENRYTDWANYYPYRTLRNLWMLSDYFPPELLQIEFLNKWRNKDKYPQGDPFVPYLYDFDYVFATTMAGQPLAWFEATGLPQEALSTSKVIKAYRERQENFHAGFILPIGSEPSGTSWTGFHSFHPGSNDGYLLIFRERNNQPSAKIQISYLPEGTYSFTKVMGEGNGNRQVVGSDKFIEFNLPNPDSFQLLKYSLIQQNPNDR